MQRIAATPSTRELAGTSLPTTNFAPGFFATCGTAVSSPERQWQQIHNASTTAKLPFLKAKSHSSDAAGQEDKRCRRRQTCRQSARAPRRFHAGNAVDRA
jgi:hypothetical protein